MTTIHPSSTDDTSPTSTTTDPAQTTVPAPASPADPTDAAGAGLREDLLAYASAGGFSLTADTHAWYAAADTIAGPEEARAASTVLAELRSRDLPATSADADRLLAATTLGKPTTVVAVAESVALLLRVKATLSTLVPEVYASADLDALAAATADASWRKEQGVKLSWGRRFTLTRAARRLAVTPRIGRGELHAALRSASLERTEWAALSPANALPALPAVAADAELLDGTAQAVVAIGTGLRELSVALPGCDATTLTFEQLAELVDRLTADEGTLFRLPTLRALRDSIEARGYGSLLKELTVGQADSDAVNTAVDALFRAEPATQPKAESEAEATAEVDTEADAEVQAQPEKPAEPEERTEFVPAPRDGGSSTPPAAPVAATVEAEAIEAEAEVEAEAEAEAVEAEVEAEAEAVEAEALVEAEVEVEVEAETVAEVEAADEEAAESEAVAEIAIGEIAVDEEATAAAEPEVEVVVAEVEVVEAAVEPEVEPESAAEPEVEPAAEPVAEIEPAAEAVTKEKPVTEPEPEAVAEPVAEAVAAAPAEATAPVEVAAPAPAETAATEVPGKPDFTPGRPVSAYSADELAAVVRWLDGDGTERSAEELLRAAMKEFGFSRLGPRIKEALGAAIDQVRG